VDAEALRRRLTDESAASFAVLLRELKGVSHNLKMNVLAPVLAEFFAGIDGSTSRKDSR
jgi:hypothetical protein